LAIDTPPAWLALPHDSIHDLDNIMLSELPATYSSQGVEAIFQLDHIILAGHAREVPSDIPPRGLQVVLSDLLRNQEVDTIIMANVSGPS
jgi:UDP-glucose:glycoprotein glucosyltransferase